jgi:hypothetical protein
VQNVGNSPVTLTNLYVNGVLNGSATFSNNSPALAINQTSTAATSVPTGFNPANAITVKVVCSDGTFMEATQIVPGS